MHRRSPPGLQDELRPFPLAHPRYLDGKSNPEFLADRPSTSSGLSQGARPFMEDFTASNPMPPPTERLGTTSLSYNPGSTEAVNQQRPGSNTLQRPATAPMSQAETLTQLLPPKRELPFGKPFSKDTLSSTNPIVKRGISVLDLPPLPTPTIVENPKLPSTATPSSTKKNMPAPRSRKKPSPRAKSNAKGKAQATQSLKETPVGEAPEKGSMQYPLLASKTVPQIETLDSVGTPSRTLRTLGDATSNSRQNDPKPPLLGLNQQASSNAIQFAPSSSVNIVSDASPTVPVNPTDEEWMDRVDAFVARHAARLPPMQAKDLSAYAAQSDEERMAQIDNMICDYIKDPNFVKLCEDVENSWRRIAGDY